MRNFIRKDVIMFVVFAMINVLLIRIANIKSEKISILKDRSEKLEELISGVIGNVLDQYKNERLYLKYPFFIVDEFGIKKDIEEISLNMPILVFRYSDLNCQSCVDAQLKLIRDACENNKNMRVMFIANYANKRDLILFKKLNKLDFPIYQIGKKQLNPILDEKNFPYYFMLDSKGEMSFIHLPLKELPNITHNYLEVINERFFENK